MLHILFNTLLRKQLSLLNVYYRYLAENTSQYNTQGKKVYIEKVYNLKRKRETVSTIAI